jgi:hypothetical protein
MSKNKTKMAASTEKEYIDTLNDLTVNSRPHIMALTELASESSKTCPKAIVAAIEKRIKKVRYKKKIHRKICLSDF